MPSKYPVPPLDLSRLQTYPLAARRSKVSRDQLGSAPEPGESFRTFWERLPDVLAVSDLRDLVNRMHGAREQGQALLWGIGAHVIKVGLSPLVIDLMNRGYVSGIALNGAGIVHDFEMAVAGQTSEEVAEVLGAGKFGMAEETGALLNDAIRLGVDDGLGLGESVSAFLAKNDPTHKEVSILWNAYRLTIPVTVHVAVGTDIIHMHPQASGAAIGEGSLQDFRLFASLVRALHGGGVYLNFGSAVILPEVFLKAVSVVRNLRFPLSDFSTANFDFIRHYRPRVNVVERPVTGKGRGFDFVGHHELLLPLLAAALVEAAEP
ncbi:MAG TPA: hypothetical protein VLK65_30195 [Vicinamibacteria bacterium]|nr:hypothetical protein [Vicinamibacteria bacterium]